MYVCIYIYIYIYIRIYIFIFKTFLHSFLIYLILKRVCAYVNNIKIIINIKSNVYILL